MVIAVADPTPLKSAADASTAAKILSTTLPCRPWPTTVDLCHWAGQLKVLHHPAVGAGEDGEGGEGGGGKKKHGRKGKGGRR